MSSYPTGTIIFLFCMLVCLTFFIFYTATLLINEFGLLFKIVGTLFMTVSFGFLVNYCDSEAHKIRMAELNKRREEEEKNKNK